jgi:hypothetical protein
MLLLRAIRSGSILPRNGTIVITVSPIKHQHPDESASDAWWIARGL